MKQYFEHLRIVLVSQVHLAYAEVSAKACNIKRVHHSMSTTHDQGAFQNLLAN